MIDGTRLELEKWTNRLDETGGHEVVWTRLTHEGEDICNALEDAAWGRNPVQVILNAGCGYPDCAVGGYVHVSRLGEHLLWSRPQIDKTDRYEVEQYLALPVVQRLGAVQIPVEVWESWQRRVEQLPPAASFEPTRRVDLADAWMLDTPAPFRAESVDELLDVVGKWILACDPISPEEALQAIARLCNWVKEAPEEAVSGGLASASAGSAEVATLYLDGPKFEEWPALARVGADFTFAIGKDWMYVP